VIPSGFSRFRTPKSFADAVIPVDTSATINAKTQAAFGNQFPKAACSIDSASE
jgi:hypothetical protein